MIQIERIAVLNRDDLAVITRLFDIFTRVTFNGRGEILAELDYDLPIIGKLVVSYYAGENHIQVRRGNDTIFNGTFFDAETANDIESRTQVLNWVKTQLLAALNK